MKRFIINPSECQYSFLNNTSYSVYKIAIQLIAIDDSIGNQDIENGFYFMTEQYESDTLS